MGSYLDPAVDRGIVSSSEGFFETHGYNNEAPGDVEQCAPTCPGFTWGGWCLKEGGDADCSDTSVNGEAGNILSLTPIPVSITERHFKLDVVGYIPCLDTPLGLKPAIDVHLVLAFRQVCVDGVLQPMEYRVVSGKHDGFPWHEMYLKLGTSSTGSQIYKFDPCTEEDGPNPWVLWGDGDDVHVLTQIPQLADWRVVPGQ